MLRTTVRKSIAWLLVCGMGSALGWPATQDCLAELITLHHYRLGEEEGGVVGNTGSDPTVDQIGGANLGRVGTPTYAASEVAGSRLSMSFDNVYGVFNSPMHAQDRYHEPLTVEVTDPLNWGLEAWVYLNDIPEADQDTEVVFFHVGSFEAGGSITLQIGGGNYWIHAPGAFLADSMVPADDMVGKWTHLAMVNDEGLVSLYRDGEELVSHDAGAIQPAEGITLGAMFLNGVAGADFARGINGRIDEVRIFEFEPGEFDIDETFLHGVPGTRVLQAGDADQDWDFDQLDLVKVQIAGKYLTSQTATWGDGDWDGAPGGEPGNPPAGDGRFDQLDIIAALNANTYLTGPYAAAQPPRATEAGWDGQLHSPLDMAPNRLVLSSLTEANLVPVPEPSGAVLFGLWVLTHCWCCRRSRRACAARRS